MKAHTDSSKRGARRQIYRLCSEGVAISESASYLTRVTHITLNWCRFFPFKRSLVILQIGMDFSSLANTSFLAFSLQHKLDSPVLKI